MRLIKGLIKGFFILAALLVAGAYAALQFIDTDKIKQLAIEKVAQETSRVLAIEGSITPKLGLKPSVIIENVSLSNPKWAKNKQLISAESITLSANLMPLLQKKVEITDITISDASISPESSKKGSKSWIFSKETTQSAEKSPETPTNNAPSNANVDLSINQITINNSSINYVDHKSGAAHILAIDTLSVEGVSGSTFESATLKGRYNNAAIQATASLDGNLMKLNATMAKGSASVKTSGTIAIADQSFELSLNANAPQLKQLMTLAGKENNDSSAISVTTNLSGTAKMMSFNNLQAIYGNTQIDGKGKLNLSKEKPYVSAKLNIPNYKIAKKAAPAPTASTDAPASDAPAPAAKPEAKLPVDALGALNADIALTIGKVALDKMDLSDVKSTIKLNQKVLTLNPLSLNTPHGSLSGTVTLDGNTEIPTLSISAKTDDMKLAALVKTLTGHSQFTGGKLISNINLKGSGHTLTQALNAASGTVNLYINDATYKVPETAKSAAQFFDLIGSEKDKEIVNVSCLVSKMNVTNGIAKPEILALKTPAAIVTGSGSINLPESRMDMSFKARGTAAVSLSDLTPPIRIQGPFSSLSYIPDPAGTVIGLGKIFLGTASGVGLAAILGEKVTDGLGITADNNPCLMSISEELAEKEKEKPKTAKETYKKLEDNFRVKRDVIKKDTKKEIKRIENDVKNIRDGFLGILGKE